MLEQMRRQGASIFIYLIFTLLIVIFVINFAPSRQRGDLEGGCATSSNTVVAVDGRDANQTAYLVAYSANGASGRQKVYVALEQLIRRELLAQAAADRGIRTNGDMADEEIKRGGFFLGGQRIDFTRQFFDDHDGEMIFNIKRFKGWVGSLNVSLGSYREEQARGLQAAMMGTLLSGAVRVSREEALANYLYENNTVTYDVVTFDPGKYRPAMKLTDADIKRFLETHEAEVQAKYKADAVLYKNTKRELALREIFIPKATPEAAKPADDKAAKPADDKAKPAEDKAAKPEDKKAEAEGKKPDDKTAKPADKKPDDKAAKPADKKAEAESKKADDKTAKPADKKADKKPGVGDAPKPYGLPVEVAKAKLEAVRAAIQAGKLTFTDAEKQLAADSSEDAPASNGDRGWRSAENAELSDKEVNEAVKTLKAGHMAPSDSGALVARTYEMTPVIVTERGAYLVIATDEREGDLSYDQVKKEIATTLAKEAWSKEAAKRDALDALAKAQAGKALNQLFERELVKPPAGDDILNMPGLTPEQRMQLQELMRQKHGSLDVHETDVPVAWTADDDGSAASPPAGGAATLPAPGGAPAPAAGSAAQGSAAAGTPGAGSGSAAPPAPPAPPPPPKVIEATNEVLPQFGNMPKAKVNSFGPSPRMPKMPGIGGSKEAIDALFDELAPGGVAKKVYPGDNDTYVVVQLVNRAQPNAEEFDKTADAEIARMRDARGKAALHDWLKNRCEALTKAGRIRPAADRIRETDDKGQPAATKYHPCMYFDVLDR